MTFSLEQCRKDGGKCVVCDSGTGSKYSSRLIFDNREHKYNLVVLSKYTMSDSEDVLFFTEDGFSNSTYINLENIHKEIEVFIVIHQTMRGTHTAIFNNQNQADEFIEEKGEDIIGRKKVSIKSGDDSWL